MKKTLRFIAAIVLLTAFTTNTNAQFKFSAGLETGFALESGYGLMYGASIGGELGIGDDNMGITAQVGYILNSVEGSGASSSMLPMQLGYKFYFNDNESGPYVHGQLGIHIFKFSYEFESFSYPNGFFSPPVITTETVSISESCLSYAFGGGYLINEHIDLGLRFNILSATGGSFNYIGIRAAYQF